MSHYPTGDPESKTPLERLRKAFPDLVEEASDYRGDLSIRIPRDRIVETLAFLKSDDATAFDLMVDLCGVDWMPRKPRFDVVYHLYSISKKHRIRVHVGVPEDDPVVESAVSVYKACDWFERECYDLLGVMFRGHPRLRRLLTHDEFQGHPLRKDYDQRQRWRCTKVSDLESTVEVPAAESSK